MFRKLSLVVGALLLTPSLAHACVRICNIKTGECQCLNRFEVDGTIVQPVEQDTQINVTPESFDALKSHLETNANPKK